MPNEFCFMERQLVTFNMAVQNLISIQHQKPLLGRHCTNSYANLGHPHHRGHHYHYKVSSPYQGLGLQVVNSKSNHAYEPFNYFIESLE